MNKARKPGAADRERIVKDEKCCRRNCKAARHLAFGSLAHEQALHLGESRDFTQEQHAKGDAFASRLLDPPLLQIHFLTNQKPGIQMLLRLV